MEGQKMNERLFLSLGEQLRHEIFFVSDVSRPYYNPEDDLRIIDFKYKNSNYKMVLNGSIKLVTNKDKMEIESFDDLVGGLIKSMHKN